MNRRRLVEAAFLLPWLGTFLLTPPAVLIVQSWARSTGFPLFIVYIFACWAMLILLGGILSVRLARLDETQPDPARRIRPPDDTA